MNRNSDARRLRPRRAPHKHTRHNKYSSRHRINFRRINRAALGQMSAVLNRYLPGGRLCGREYTVRNPTRPDRHYGSFKVNVVSGKWADFATTDRGGDPISLVAYVLKVGQVQAAEELRRFLRIR